VKMKVVVVTSVSTLQGPMSVPAIVVMNLMKMDLLAMVSDSIPTLVFQHK